MKYEADCMQLKFLFPSNASRSLGMEMQACAALCFGTWFLQPQSDSDVVMQRIATSRVWMILNKQIRNRLKEQGTSSKIKHFA